MPNDPSFTGQWPLNNTGQNNGVADADIDAAEAWDITTGNPDVVVAVLDTGIDYNHDDLAANIFSNSADCDADGSDDDVNGSAGNAVGEQTRQIDETHLFEAGSMFPCAYPLPNVICVGNSTRNDRMAFTSFVGDHTVHVFAPGQDVLSTLPGNQYGVQTGTSMANCNSGSVTRRVQPRTPAVVFHYWVDVPMTLAVMNIDCEQPRGPVSVQSQDFENFVTRAVG